MEITLQFLKISNTYGINGIPVEWLQVAINTLHSVLAIFHSLKCKCSECIQIIVSTNVVLCSSVITTVKICIQSDIFKGWSTLQNCIIFNEENSYNQILCINVGVKYLAKNICVVSLAMRKKIKTVVLWHIYLSWTPNSILSGPLISSLTSRTSYLCNSLPDNTYVN